MRRIADMYPGTAKTEEKDAFIIADAARTMPHTLRIAVVSDEDEATLCMLTGLDLDLARQITQTSNRIRGLFTQIHPPLERLLGPWLEHDAVLEVLSTWPTPALLKHGGKARIDEKLKKHGARRHTIWANAIFDAFNEQSVVVVGTDATGLVVPHLTKQMISLHAQRVYVATHLEAMVEAPSLPGPDFHARSRSQDDRDHHCRDLRQDFQQCRGIVLLRRMGTNHAPAGPITTENWRRESGTAKQLSH